jgi:hypothetical protein
MAQLHEIRAAISTPFESPVQTYVSTNPTPDRKFMFAPLTRGATKPEMARSVAGLA